MRAAMLRADTPRAPGGRPAASGRPRSGRRGDAHGAPPAADLAVYQLAVTPPPDGRGLRVGVAARDRLDPAITVGVRPRPKPTAVAWRSTRSSCDAATTLPAAPCRSP